METSAGTPYDGYDRRKIAQIDSKKKRIVQHIMRQACYIGVAPKPDP
jgi:hypothetical protein